MTIAGADPAAAQCGGTTTSTDVPAGQRAGPFTICFAVGGSTSAPRALVWIGPEDLSIVGLQLPEA